MAERSNGSRPDWACVVLAAGAGTRMNSRIPKPLHTLGGKSIVSHVLNAAKGAEVGPITLLHDGSGTLPEAIGEAFQYAVQQERDGTGGAVVMQLKVNGDDFLFKQYDGTEVIRFTDGGHVEVKDNLSGELHRTRQQSHRKFLAEMIKDDTVDLK